MIGNEQIAHGLTLAYINNRYGAEVSGSFYVSTIGDEVTGSGTVETGRLPHVGSKRLSRKFSQRAWCVRLSTIGGGGGGCGLPIRSLQ